MEKEYTFNTGVKPFSFNPPAAMAFMSGFRDSGNGVYVIPFMCEEVPTKSRCVMCCDTPNMKGYENFIVREIRPGSRILSKYAYFTNN